MVKNINTVACTGCGLCEKICPADLFRMDEENHVMTIVYQADCCNCLQCKYICPVDAIEFSPAEPKKLNMDGEWAAIKKLMGAVDNPMAEETRKPMWQKMKEKAEKEGHKKGNWNGKQF